MKPATRNQKLWITLTFLQAIGCASVVIGTAANATLQIIGCILLVPGSVFVAFLPLQRLWLPFMWRFAKTNPTGLSNLLYLPCVVLFNVALLWSIKWLQSRRRQRSQSKIETYSEMKVRKSEA